MPRRNFPPYVQVLRRAGEVAGYRGWWTVGAKRQFGPTRKTADDAHADAVKARKVVRDDRAAAADWQSRGAPPAAASTVQLVDSAPIRDAIAVLAAAVEGLRNDVGKLRAHVAIALQKQQRAERGGRP